MSAKNRLDEKRARKMRRALRVPLRSQIDLVDWLKLHGHADTVGAAKKLIHERKVKSESHILGFQTVEIKDDDGEVTDTEEVYSPFVPSSVRETLMVVPDEAVASTKS